MQSKRLEWQELERSSTKPEDKRPPFSMIKLSIKEFTHLGQAGELNLVIFNDQLMSATFFPDNPEIYREVAEPFTGAAAPNVSMLESTDYLGRYYIQWQDKRLVKAMQRWLRTYS